MYGRKKVGDNDFYHSENQAERGILIDMEPSTLPAISHNVGFGRRRAALCRVQFLKSLPDDVLDELACAGRERRLHRGELLFAEHDRCLGLIVVLAGAIKVYKLDSRGRELTLDSELPGESVFELPLFDGGNYPASAEASQDGTVVYIICRERFGQFVAANPQIAALALRALAVRTRKLIQMVEAHSLHSARARLAAYLLQTAGERARFILPETNEAIGSRIGTVREVVSRTLHSFKDAGLLRLCGREVILCEPDALKRLAGIEGVEAED